MDGWVDGRMDVCTWETHPGDNGAELPVTKGRLRGSGEIVFSELLGSPRLWKRPGDTENPL